MPRPSMYAKCFAGDKLQVQQERALAALTMLVRQASQSTTINYSDVVGLITSVEMSDGC